MLGRPWGRTTSSIGFWLTAIVALVVPGRAGAPSSCRRESRPASCKQQRATSGRYTSMVFTEYVVVLGLVVLTVGLAIYALGVPLVHAYYLTKLFILLPIP